jgi:hypothetical protein
MASDDMYKNYVFFAWCRFYVQPQWIFDSINRRSKLNERDYALGRFLLIFITLLFSLTLIIYFENLLKVIFSFHEEICQKGQFYK